MNKLTFGKSFKVRNVIIDKHTRLIPLALTRLDTPNIFRYTLLFAILILEKVVFLCACPERKQYNTVQKLLHNSMLHNSMLAALIK